MPSVHRAGVDIHYEVHGSGPRVLVCNGSGATIAGTQRMIDLLAADLQVAVHDQRCLGRTGVPPEPPTMADYAADAVAVLDDLGWDTASVFGISFGGMVALELAVTTPGRLDRLALLCTSAGGAGGSSAPLHELARLPAEERLARTILNMDTRFTEAWLAEHPRDRAIVDDLRRRSSEAKDDEVRRGELMQLDARATHDVWDRLDRITCPTLIACGRTDGQAPLANSESLHSRIRGSDVRVYDGGHLFIWQDRTALPEVVAFLRGGSPRSLAPAPRSL